MSTLFDLLKRGAIKPIIADALPLSAARDVHERVALIVLLPWANADETAPLQAAS